MNVARALHAFNCFDFDTHVCNSDVSEQCSQLLLLSRQEGKQANISIWFINTMPRLTENQRNQSFGQLQAGASVSNVALHLNVQRNTIYALQRRYHATGRTQDGVRSGRPHVTTAAQDRFICTTHLRNREIRHFAAPVQTIQQLANALQVAWNNIPQQTMRRLILSMRRRCNTVIAARGHHTHY